MRQIYTALGLLLILCATQGCESSSVSERYARQALDERLAEELDGRAQMASFSKTNGQMSERNSVPFYTMEFSGKLEFTRDSGYRKAAGGIMVGEHPRSTPGMPGNYMGLSPVREGERIDVAGTLVFEKKESGWALTSIAVR